MHGRGTCTLVIVQCIVFHRALVTIVGYANNSDFLNHCIISFLKRICNPKGLNLEPMLYQVHNSHGCAMSLCLAGH